jgi:hypothetical protein
MIVDGKSEMKIEERFYFIEKKTIGILLVH